jgi:hypothetical protein
MFIVAALLLRNKTTVVAAMLSPALMQAMRITCDPRIVRRVAADPAHGHGLVVAAESTGIVPGTVLARVPLACCVCRETVAAVDTQRLLGRSLADSYEHAVPSDGMRQGASLQFARDTGVLAAFLASQRCSAGPLGRYATAAIPATFAASQNVPGLSAEHRASVAALASCRAAIIEQMYRDLAGSAVWDASGFRSPAGADAARAGVAPLCFAPFSLADFVWAHAALETRCIDLGDGDEGVSGPVLIPLVDVINHGGGDANVALRVDHDAAGAFPSTVTLVAAAALRGGDQLAYPYLDDDADAVDWALRFRFLP